MFERENLSGSNFNDWFRSPKMVLRVEKKLFVIEQPIPPAPAANVLAEWNAVYDAHNEELKSMFEKQAGVERFDLIQTFHACKQEEGKPVGQYVIKMKGYVEQLERLGYVLPQDLSVGLILNGLTSDFAGFVRNHNKHNMGKTIDKLHALLIEIRSKLALPVLQGLRGARKLKQGDLYLYMGNGVHAQVEAIGSYDLVLPNGLVLRSDRGGEYISQEFKDYLKACGIVLQLTSPYTPQHNGVSEKRNCTLLDMVRSMMNLTTLPLFFWDYALESAARILNMVPTKKVDKTPYEL
ncbi:zinc finger, CCHC-type containing protein [Tanacetum coccineum]